MLIQQTRDELHTGTTAATRTTLTALQHLPRNKVEVNRLSNGRRGKHSVLI